MSTLSGEGKVDLGFDTVVMREYGARYAQIADDLTEMAEDLDRCLQNLAEDGWTTPAGTAFYELAQTDWEANIRKYANLLKTLDQILRTAADEYDALYGGHIETTKLN